MARNERGCIAASLTISVLGPFQLTMNGQPLTVTSGRLRTLLTALAVCAGQPVSVDRLAAALWGDRLPGNPRRGVQLYLVRLRDLIGEASVATTPNGYALRLSPDNVDALRFEQLLDAGEGEAAEAVRYARLREALRLWRGTPFEDIDSPTLAESEAPRLTERYLVAVEQRVDLDLAAGQTKALVAELGELTTRFPLRESLWRRLLVALDRCGRQAEALDRYEAVRSQLADELGVDPGPDLQRLYTNLLAGRSLRPSPEPVVTPGVQRPVPRQLPADVATFAGREDVLKYLDEIVPRDPTPDPAVAVVHGPAGVGKTALAVHWAHQVAERFPDGQLYVNLRGFDPSGPALAAADTLRGFLDALGTPPDQIPATFSAQVGLYRSMLADRRVLIMLDNAADVGQVRPMLPTGAGCLAIVTSRNRLPGLVVADGARPVELDPLSLDEARLLLERRLGRERIAAEPAAVDDIVHRCGGLPLALAIVAARAMSHPKFPLAALTVEPCAAPGRLDALAGLDAETDVRVVFSWSYRPLPTSAARLFRLLGVHPADEVTAPAAASLAAVPVGQARLLLVRLAQANLVTEHAPGRYAPHDLLRAYAAELAARHDTDVDRRAALHRVLDHYLHTGCAASRLIDPHRLPITLSPPQPGTAPEPLHDNEQAIAWFHTERTAILSAIERASIDGFDTHVWQLAWSVAQFLAIGMYWRDQLAVLGLALASATRLGLRSEQARVHRHLGQTLNELGDYDKAHEHLRSALELYEHVGDCRGRAVVHSIRSQLFADRQMFDEALTHAREAYELFRAMGDRRGEGYTLDEIGCYHAWRGDLEQALAYCERAIVIQRQIDDKVGLASTWDSLGYINQQLGRCEDAVSRYQQALDLYRQLGHHVHEAETLDKIGDTHHAAGNGSAAAAAWRQSVNTFAQLGSPEADAVRTKLSRTHPAPAPRRE